MTLPTNAFIGNPEQPTEAELEEALGPTKQLWDQLKTEPAQEHDVTTEEWLSYSRKSGWSLRLRRKKRASSTCRRARDCFTSPSLWGTEPCKPARESKLPKRVTTILDQARRYAEGTQFQMEVKKPADVGVIKKLAVIKIDH